MRDNIWDYNEEHHPIPLLCTKVQFPNGSHNSHFTLDLTGKRRVEPSVPEDMNRGAQLSISLS